MKKLTQVLCEMQNEHRMHRIEPLRIGFSSTFARDRFVQAVEADIGMREGELRQFNGGHPMFDGIAFEVDKPLRSQTAPLKFWAA